MRCADAELKSISRPHSAETLRDFTIGIFDEMISPCLRIRKAFSDATPVTLSTPLIEKARRRPDDEGIAEPCRRANALSAPPSSAIFDRIARQPDGSNTYFANDVPRRQLLRHAAHDHIRRRPVQEASAGAAAVAGGAEIGIARLRTSSALRAGYPRDLPRRCPFRKRAGHRRRSARTPLYVSAAAAENALPPSSSAPSLNCVLDSRKRLRFADTHRPAALARTDCVFPHDAV